MQKPGLFTRARSASKVPVTYILVVVACASLLVLASPGIAFGWGSEGENGTVIVQHQPDVTACVACHPATGYGDSPHGGFTNGTNRCKICHWVHNAPLGGASLLPGPTVADACRTCHDGTGAAGVYGVLVRRGLAATPGSAHRVYGDPQVNVIPGGDPTTGGSRTQVFGGEGGYLSCDDCHSPHANKVVAAFTKPRLRSSSPESDLGGLRKTTALLKQTPTGATAATTVYGSDWCAGCHQGRHSGGSVINHPVDSTLETPSPFNYDSVAVAFGQYAVGIGVNGSDVFVADPGNMRVQKFTTGGAYVSQRVFSGNPYGGDNWQALAPAGLAVNGSGEVWVSLPGYSTNDWLQGAVIRRLDSNLDLLGDVQSWSFWRPNSVAFSPAGDAIYSALNYKRLDKLVILYAGGGSAEWENSFGTGAVDTACGIAADSAGNIYVANTNCDEIRKYDSSLALVASWGTSGAGNGQFNRPMGIALDSANNVYVADTGNNRIQKFTSAGAYVGQWGTQGSGNGQFAGPSGVAIDGSDNVYVADAGNDRVQKFTSTGTFVLTFGGTGAGDGEFNFTQTSMGSMSLTNGGYVMPMPRTTEQGTHYPICQQCHSDTRKVGFLTGGWAASRTWRVGLDGTYGNHLGGTEGFGNPTVQVFPHEAVNDSFIVETNDGLCDNCHDPMLLP